MAEAKQLDKATEDAVIRKTVHQSATQFARGLVEQGFDRVAVMEGFKAACADLRDDALDEAEPGGNA